ncbi:MAG: hypothetical protein HMLKMBBP_00788 [Planctomycetes bacterium]|nr:hypothetical protein [Planctomycetota bacterium]
MRTLRRRRTHAAAAGVLLLAGTAAAVDTVDLQVGFRDRVSGTIRPADERESYYLATFPGVEVKATVKRVGAGALVPRLALLDGDGIATLAEGAPTAKGAKLAGYRVTDSDAVRVRVEGDGAADGDYQLDLKLKAARTATSVSGDVEPQGVHPAVFGAPRGADVRIDARTQSGSGAVPQLVLLRGIRSGAVIDISGTVPSGTRSVADVDGLPADDAWEVTVANGGTSPGAIAVKVTISAAKPPRTTVDLTDVALNGEFAGAQAVVGRFADPAASTLIEGLPGLGLDGVSIEIPQGAVSLPTLISMTESAEVFSGDDESAAGGTVEFQPAGTEFAIPATVTLPYDPETVDDPMTDIEIVTENADGTQERTTPSSVDTDAETVSFPASHFSRFQPVTRRPRPFAGRFVAVEMVGVCSEDFGNGVSFELHELDSLTGPRVTRPVARRARGGAVFWSQSGGSAILNPVALDASDTGSATVVGTQRVDLAVGNDNYALDRDRDPRVYSALSAGSAFVRAYLVFRRPDGAPTPVNLAGRWRMLFVETSARPGGNMDDPAAIDVTGVEAVIDVALDGRVSASSQRRVTYRQSYPVSEWSLDRRNLGLVGITLLPSGDEAVLRTLRNSVPLVPALGGELLVGAFGGKAEDADVAQLVLLVREADGATPQAVTDAGRFLSRIFSVAPSRRVGAPATLAFAGTTGPREHFAGDPPTLRQLGTLQIVEHVAAGVSALDSVPLAGSVANPFRVTPQGLYDASGIAADGFVVSPRPVLLFADSTPDAIAVGAGFRAR